MPLLVTPGKEAESDAPLPVDGLRIDTAWQVDTGFWSGFLSAAGVFATGEFDDDDASIVCSGQDYLNSVLNYAT